jgi:nucleoside-diphosphate-sugar epimerase
MKPTVVVTGAGGFVGRNLKPALESAGFGVVPLARGDADVTDAGRLLERARPAEAVIHLAFPASRARREGQPEESRRLAESGTANALALAEACGARQFVLASSGKVYGKPVSLPIEEDHPTAPAGLLGELKLLQEQITRSSTRRFGSTSLRLFNLYGPDAPGEFLLPRLLAGFRDSSPLILGELDHRRDWIHIQDACAAFVAAVRNPPEPGEFRPLNAGSGRSASVRDLYGILAAISGRRPEIRRDPGRLRPDEPVEERADCRRLMRLGWRVQVDLDTGMERLWNHPQR